MVVCLHGNVDAAARIPVLLPHAAATAVPRVPASWLARRCLNDPSKEAVGSTSALEDLGDGCVDSELER